uniref:Suppressor of Ty 6 homolog n=1 Tax=Heterorhabditis bacteriophora TaxID=37862 RepID=A0A1I7XT04_HETBA
MDDTTTNGLPHKSMDPPSGGSLLGQISLDKWSMQHRRKKYRLVPSEIGPGAEKTSISNIELRETVIEIGDSTIEQRLSQKEGLYGERTSGPAPRAHESPPRQACARLARPPSTLPAHAAARRPSLHSPHHSASFHVPLVSLRFISIICVLLTRDHLFTPNPTCSFHLSNPFPYLHMDFLDRQAEESEGETSDSSLNDDQPKTKKLKLQKEKKKKNNKRVVESDDDDDDDDVDDDEEGAEEMKGFIADEEEEDGDDEKSEKSEKLDDEEEEELDEDDMDLIQENLDIRKKKQRIIQPDDSDEEDDRTAIQKKLFGEGDDDGEGPSSVRDLGRVDGYSDREGYSDSEQSEDNFIVNEDGGRSLHRHHRRRDANMPEGALDEARDVFGVEDFNFDEFYDEDEEPIEDEEDDLMEDDGDGEARIRRVRPKEKKSTLLDTMEPSELERGYLAPADKKVQLEDKPERFQLRRTPVSEADEAELDLEAKWIYQYAFGQSSVSRQASTQLAFLNDLPLTERAHVEGDVVDTIKEALKFIRNQLFENKVLFLFFFKLYCLIELMKRMQNYQLEGEMTHRRVINEADFNDVYGVDCVEALSDVSAQFQLFYGNDISRMHEWERHRQALSLSYFIGLLKATENEEDETAGIENLDWKKHEVEQDPVSPRQAAEDYISSSFPTVDAVIAGAVYVMSREISRQPQVRERIRRLYRRRVTVSVRPTKQGREQMDDTHPIWSKRIYSLFEWCYYIVLLCRYVKDKEVSQLENEDYLYYHQAKTANNLEVQLSCDKDHEKLHQTTLADTIIMDQPFRKDEFSDVVEEWNNLRDQCVRMAINDMLIPFFEQELHQKLIEEAKECVIKKCTLSMYTRLETAAYRPSEEELEDEDEDITRHGEVRVLAIAYSTEMDEASFAALVDQDGAVIDYCRLVHFVKRSFGQGQNQRLKVESYNETMGLLKKFVERRRPHVIGLAGENMDAIRLKRDLEDMVNNMVSDNELSRAPPVFIIDNDAAKVYMQSKSALVEHAEYPPTLRQAVSLTRLLLDPLPEYAHLWNADEDIFCLSLHPLQNEINKEELGNALARELINRVNEVGVDVNKCLDHPHTANLLQFVCGLGPRKATHLLKTLKQHDNLLESRTKLVTLCRMGPKVFMNCAGFIKIETTRVAEKTDAYVEVLDGSRVHPETYEWARKMAVDALECNSIMFCFKHEAGSNSIAYQVDDSADPTAALEEILQAPDRLKDLDLDAFAEELKRQGFGEKKATLYDISAELNHRYKDMRMPFTPIKEEDLFTLLTKESKLTFVEDRRVCGTVIGVQYKRIPDDQRTAYINGEQHMQRIGETTFWECSFCRTPCTSSDLYEHIQNTDTRTGGCPGIPVGIRVRLENGINGFIPNKMISDRPESFKNPLERVKINQPIFCRIIKIEPEKFSCLLSCRSSDLQRESDELRDSWWDREAEEEDKTKDAEAKNNKKQGDAIVRPSSKSNSRLTVTWKVAEGVVQNIDVEEKDKEQPFTLGKRLIIHGDEFEDLDEIIARYIQPMASFAREIIQHKYFWENAIAEEREQIEAKLQEEKRASPARIPYTLTPSREYPGKFVLSYIPKLKACHEFMTVHILYPYFSVTTEGVRFRQQIFGSLDSLLGWFKIHYREPPPVVRTHHAYVDLLGEFHPPTDEVSKMFAAIKKINNNVKLLHSIIGQNTAFSTMVESTSSISRFANESYTYLSKFGFDGLDIDWEFPSWGSHSRRSDKIRFTMFLKVLMLYFSPSDYKYDYINLGTDKLWLSIEDVRSVSAKAEYAKDLRIAGVMVFHIGSDDVTGSCGNGKFPLLKAIQKIFM